MTDSTITRRHRWNETPPMRLAAGESADGNDVERAFSH
jgi:hypothetical protein